MKNIENLLLKISKEEPSKEAIDTLITLVRELCSKVRHLKDEIARLKNQPPRPKIKPSLLEQKNKLSKNESKLKNWSKKSKNNKLRIDEEQTIKVPKEEVPVGAIFKGYKEFIVQELIITKKNTRYHLEQWEKSDGTYVIARLPGGVAGHHFGSGLRQYIVHQHHANRVPQNRIKTDLEDKGIKISSGQIDNILKKVAQQLKPEKEKMLSAGLQSGHLQVDDTGSRHQGKNGFTTVICNDIFTFFKSSKRKSRINFLETLCGKNIDYRITAETIDYIKNFTSARSRIELIKQNLSRYFADHESWNEFLQEHHLGKGMQRIFTEGALLGSLIQRGDITLNTILISDGARQFDLLTHALCWIHVERSIKKLIPIDENDRLEIDQVLDNFWNFYKKLKAYKEDNPDKQGSIKQGLNDQFDEIFSFRATSTQLVQALKRIQDNKSELLLVLDYPDIPLHNNTSERDIREYVTVRKVSGGTRSDAGRNARDTLISLYKTCKKHSISFWAYLGDRINKKNSIPPLSNLIRQKSCLHSEKSSVIGC